MFSWGTILSLGATALSGALSINNNKNVQANADAEAARQSSHYGALANEDPLARSENQKVMAEYDRRSKEQLENARGVAAITGATPEFALGVQKGIAEGRADLMGSMAANASARKDYFNAKKEQVEHDKFLADQQRALDRNQTYASLASNAMTALGGIVDSYGAKNEKGPRIVKSPSKIETNVTGVDVGKAPAPSAQEILETGIPELKKRLNI